MATSSLDLDPQAAPDSGSSHRFQMPCVHCGLATPARCDSDPASIFCCSGCRGAYELIHGWGLDNYYALRDQQGQAAVAPGADRATRYDAFDSEAFLGLSTPRAQADGLLRSELAVHGLHCAACAWLIENAASRTPGWRGARVKMSDHTLQVVFDASQIRLSQIARLLDRLGYTLAPLSKNRNDAFRRENRALLAQIAIAGFCAANTMWIAIALYASEASGVAAAHWWLLRLVGTALGVAAVAGPGRTFFVGALASLRTRTPHMDVPVALGLAVGTGTGVVNALSGRGDVYFDSLAVLVFLLLVGRWIQFRQQHRAARAVDLLLRITPQHARHVQADGTTQWVLVEGLPIGATVRVIAGESLPVDGQVVSGQSLIDRSLLTGESEPLQVGRGDSVAAGTVNLTQPLEVCVAATGSQTRIGQVMQSVEAASAGKVPIVQLADRIGGVFVIVVTLLAIVTLWTWAEQGWGVAAAHATSLLIVACPCALALATPLAIAVALGRAAKSHILIRDGASLQHLAEPGILWFDKTGTLTEGRGRVEHVFGPVEAIAHAAAVESGSCHPVAEALIAEAQRRQLRVPRDAALEQVGVGGVSGISQGQPVAIGSLAFIRQACVQPEAAIEAAVESSLQRGSSPIVIALGGVATTVLEFDDPVRPQAAEMIARLQHQGWQVGILSGDHPRIVRQVAERLGIDGARVFGGQSPEQKLAAVRQRSGRAVVMIGDGANDAAALAAADVGIAVRGGAEVSLQAAPIFISSGRLSSITDLMQGASRTSRLIRTAFAVSLSYNLIAVGLAMAGQIGPLFAAVLMPISSVSVLALTLAWPTFRDPQV